MKASEHILAVQAALGIPEGLRAPTIGPITRRAFQRLSIAPIDQEFLDAPSTEAPIEVPPIEEPLPDTARNINQRTVDLVKHFESLFLKAYWDKTGECWTIGWGHTGLQHKDGTVYKGREITEAKAEQLFRYDMDQFEQRVSSLVKADLNDDQFGALVSFDFNTGALHKSSLLTKLNKGDYDGAAAEFPKWNKSGGKVLRGLTRRRASEKQLFEGVADYIIPA